MLRVIYRKSISSQKFVPLQPLKLRTLACAVVQRRWWSLKARKARTGWAPQVTFIYPVDIWPCAVSCQPRADKVRDICSRELSARSTAPPLDERVYQLEL